MDIIKRMLIFDEYCRELNEFKGYSGTETDLNECYSTIVFVSKKGEVCSGLKLDVSQQCYEVAKRHWPRASWKEVKYQHWEVRGDEALANPAPGYTLPFWCIYLLLPLSIYLFLYAHLSCVSFPIFLFLFLMPLFCHFRGKLNILECIWGRAKTSGWRIKVGTQRWQLYKLKALGSGGGDVLRSKASCFQDYQSHTF